MGTVNSFFNYDYYFEENGNQATNHNNVFSLKSVFVREIMERPIIQLPVPNKIEETERTTNDSGLIAESTRKKMVIG